MVTLLGEEAWSWSVLSQHGQQGQSCFSVESHLVQHSKQTMFPHPNSIGLSSMDMQILHDIFVCVLGKEGTGQGSGGKNEGGAMAVSVDTRSFGVFVFGLPLLPPGLPPPWRLWKC